MRLFENKGGRRPKVPAAVIRQEWARLLEGARKAGKRAPPRKSLERIFKVSKSAIDRALASK
jgi:hypothetical protein